MKTQILKFFVPVFFVFGLMACSHQPSGDQVNATLPVYSNAKEMVKHAKANIVEITPAEFKTMMDGQSEYFLIDVREKGEYDAGSIPGAVLVPRGLIEFIIAKKEFWDEKGLKMPAKDAKIVVYCKTGGRGALSALSLKELGYKDVASIKGGWKGWKEEYPDEVYQAYEKPAEEKVTEPVQPPVKKEVKTEPVESSAEEGC